MVEIIRLDLEEISSETDFNDLVAKIFSFSSYYGKNLDAFWECINEITNKTHVQISGLNAVTEPLKTRIKKYLDMLDEYAAKPHSQFIIDYA